MDFTQRVSTSHTGVAVFGPHDVLLGRKRSDTSFDNNPGNAKFRCLVSEQAPRYHQAASRSGKRKIAREVMDLIQDKGGRFLYRHQQDGQWIEARWELTVAKIKDALRHQDQQQWLACPQEIKSSPHPTVSSKTTHLEKGTAGPCGGIFQVLSGAGFSMLPELCSSFVNKKDWKKPIIQHSTPLVGMGPHDVLLGRGRVPFNNPGNKKFRNLILRHAKTYQTTTSRIVKRTTAIAVVDEINSKGGTFLHCQDGVWEEMKDMQPIKDKVGYALRDAWLQRNGSIRKTPLAQSARRVRKVAPAHQRSAAPDVEQAALQFSLSLQNAFSEIRHVPSTRAVGPFKPKQVMHDSRAGSPVTSSQNIVPFDNVLDLDEKNRRNHTLLQDQDCHHMVSNNEDPILSDADHSIFEEEHEQHHFCCSLDCFSDGGYNDDDQESQCAQEEEYSALQSSLLECINRDFDDDLMSDEDSFLSSSSSLPQHLARMQHDEEEEHEQLATDAAIGVFDF